MNILARILLTYGVSLGAVTAARLAWQGRVFYWLGLGGAGLIFFGTLWAPGFLSSSIVSTSILLGAGFAISAVVLDLLFSPGRPADSDEERLRFERFE